MRYLSGGNAADAKRSTNIKTFIRNGQSKTLIRIHLHNGGEFAYKQEEWGNEIIFEIPPQRSKRIWLQKFKLFFASVDLLITSSPIIIMILLSKCQIKFLTTSSMQVDDVIIAGFSKEYLNQNKKKGEENIQSHSIIT